MESSVLQLRSQVDSITLDIIKGFLRLLLENVSLLSVLCIENNDFTKTVVEDTDEYMEDFTRVIESSGRAGTRRLQGEQDGPSLLSWYKDKRKLLVVKVGNKLHIINDKNNSRLIKTLLDSKLQKTKTCTRRVDFWTLLTSTEELHHVNPREHHTFAKSKINLDKILPRTKPGKYIPPAERLEDHKETCSPFYGAQYRDTAHSGGTTHSIQATDGECSLLPFKNIVCSSRPLYKSFKQKSTETNSSRSNILYGRHSSCLARFPDMADLERRHASYLQEAWEIHTDRPDVKVLEDCGFFYTGQADLVRCYQCGIGLKDWSPEDDVLEEHIRHSSDCSFLKEKLGQDRLNQLKFQILYSVENDGSSYAGAALTQVPTAARSENNARSDFSSLPKYEAATNSTQTPKQGRNKNASLKLNYPVRHPDYRCMKSRLDSYVEFPPSAQQDHRRLATAGFYFTGTRDICRCFCCDGGMQHWVAEDDPIKEHAKHFPNCSYIRQLKGDEYIKRVRVEAGMEPSQENSQGTNLSATSQSSETFTTQMTALAINGTQGALSGNTDVRRSTILRNVLASGFEKVKVMKAVDVLIKKGITKFTEDDIVNTIFDTPEVNESFESSPHENDPDTLRQENNRLKSFIKCMLCENGETNILFLPCAHHKVCVKCSEKLERCPVCQKQIVQKVRTYMS